MQQWYMYQQQAAAVGQTQGGDDQPGEPLNPQQQGNSQGEQRNAGPTQPIPPAGPSGSSDFPTGPKRMPPAGPRRAPPSGPSGSRGRSGQQGRGGPQGRGGGRGGYNRDKGGYHPYNKR